ncbi:MAG: radical SAM protein [Elusimicrobiota bacterium]
MRFNKILLTNLISHEAPTFKRRTVLRAGIGYIAQSLRDNNIEYRVVDLALGYTVRDLLGKIGKFKPDVVGITMFTYRYSEVYGIIKTIRQAFPDVKIACGGPHVTTFRVKTLEQCPEIDFGIIGEGEDTVIELCSGKELSEIKGLLYRENGKIRDNGNRPYNLDLDAISFPRYANFELENYPLKGAPVSERIIPLVTSRGCPYDCIYCPVKTAIGQKFRFRSVENILLEMNHWYGLGYRRFSFIDDNFTLLKERVDKLCDAVRDAGMNDLILSLPNGIRADKIDRPLLEKMYSIGFRFIGFGVESGNNRILKILKKHETIETIETAIQNACEIGYFVDLFFLIGSPEETEKEVMESVATASRHPVDNVFYFNLIPYPETELYEWAEKNAKLLYEPEYYLNKIHSNMDNPVFETAGFPAEARRRMLKFARNSEKKRKVGQYVKKLNAKGVRGFPATFIANIYAAKFVQRLFNDIQLLAKVKSRIYSHV